MSKRTKLVLMIGGGFLFLLVAAGGVLLFAYRDVATTIDREDVGVTVITGGGRPGDFGLYLYETVGFETTDALAGSRHDYPVQTYLTIQPGGCGTLVRWQALEQRWEEWDICPDGTMVGWRSFNEWFRLANTDVWNCPQPVPLQGEPGETWHYRCARPETNQAAAAEELGDLEAVGYETLTVAGEQVETLHVHTIVTGAGGSVATGTVDTWYLPGTVLPVRRVVVHDSTTNTMIGSVEYHEEAELQLISLLPQG